MSPKTITMSHIMFFCIFLFFLLFLFCKTTVTSSKLKILSVMGHIIFQLIVMSETKDEIIVLDSEPANIRTTGGVTVQRIPKRWRMRRDLQEFFKSDLEIVLQLVNGQPCLNIRRVPKWCAINLFRKDPLDWTLHPAFLISCAVHLSKIICWDGKNE